PLLVLCHGCKQTPEDIARGTRVEALADRMGCVVLLPRQKDSANPWRCWNWFEQRTAEGKGEAAIVAAQIRRVRRAYRIDRKRVLAAGMSAGGALAAILGVRYPHLVTAVAVHSGRAAGAARSAMSALSVMKHGPDRDVERIAEDARARAAPHDVRVPLLAIHGERDDVVRPLNAIALVRQYLALNAHPAITGQPHETATLPAPDREAATRTPEGRTQVVRDWYRDGRLVARHVEVTGLGHAWSGGDTALAYNDAAAPDATALLGGFIADALSSRMAKEETR
ncbi:MAG: PHB depolymerase family esterase, partial [Burkholderiales bacterium]|nr:PHB depolymerase family esterase [Burkholderiales bacterium]